MKPTSPRAARRLAKKQAKSGALTLADLLQRVERSRIKGVSGTLETRAKRILASYLQTAQTYGLPVKQVVDEMASGQAAWRLGHAVRDEMLKTPPDAVRKAACKEGCAFCCILSGGEGGVITGFEAAQLHAALSPLAGQPDGRDWHPQACPALDPESRACRAYEARPMICRSFLSTDAAACEANANGGTEQGAGLLGSHLDYLAVHALCRRVLKGITAVQTYSLAAIAREATEGAEAETALNAARHGPAVLEGACRDAMAASAS
ncbi:YkgJ family cysteine cluster protein [Cognatiyoonia sp. IB215182]|uniref:YkgJ family cysteine cluster protein n=1 Tax=Cognatiyoonia sp. IB215182 TaxID=3097353 RepID=UPI002A0DFD94|nr:YkgJ family cysteine cluster protein [Cognatiyoonia sp. IB215182]MDX8350824.1 YkgJ family cysteine cluster protein [Cognatiyoonia sp. IB215182]